MKMIVFSDSHGVSHSMRSALQKNPDAQKIVFCGDGCREIMRLAPLYPEKELIAVRGNCDFSFGSDCGQYPLFVSFFCGDIRVAVLHGHTHNVKSSDEQLLQLAKQGYALILHGHTHIPRIRYTDCGTLLFNPGAAKDGSFGLITIQDGQILPSHGRIGA